MEIDADKILLHAIQDGIRDGIKGKLSGYNTPFDKLIESSLTKHGSAFKSLLEESIGSCMNDAAFRESIATAVRHSLAKTLVVRFGGEMEKQVNVLKSDPTTRARITLAIEEIVKQK